MSHADHTTDADCTLDQNDECTGCGVIHGDPCPACGGRGFHKDGCAEIEQAPGDGISMTPEQHAAAGHTFDRVSKSWRLNQAIREELVMKLEDAICRAEALLTDDNRGFLTQGERTAIIEGLDKLNSAKRSIDGKERHV